MARLIHVSAAEVARASATFDPFPAVRTAFKARRPGSQTAPWFELTPAAPWMDTRIDGGSEGVAATLELYGAVAGVAAGELSDPDLAVLGGNPTAAGAPPDFAGNQLRRQSAARVCVDGLVPDRGCQALILVAVQGHDAPIVQVLLGSVPLAEVTVTGEERLAVLADAPPGNGVKLDLRLRLAGTHEGVLLGLRGVQGFVL